MSINLIEEEFIPLKEALQLKELGFNEACIAFFNGGYHNGGYHDWMIESIGTEIALWPWDGHTSKDVLDRLKKIILTQTTE